MLKAGLVSISFRNKNPDEIIEAAVNAGLKIIEWGSDIHAPCNNTERLINIAEKQKRAGIEACTYGTYFKIGINSCDEIKAYIKAAKILGTDVLRVWCGNKPSCAYSYAEKQKIIFDSKTIADIAENEKVKICLEFHPYTYTDELKSASELINAVNSRSFKMYWQPNQFRTKEENIISARELAPCVENIHVFNWDGGKRSSLKGAVDEWREYASYFKGVHNMMLEFMPDDNINSLPIEADSLRKILKPSYYDTAGVLKYAENLPMRKCR